MGTVGGDADRSRVDADADEHEADAVWAVGECLGPHILGLHNMSRYVWTALAATGLVASLAAFWRSRARCSRALPDRYPLLSNVEAHNHIRTLYDAFTKVGHPHAAREFTTLVNHKPIDLARAQSIVSAVDAERLCQGGATTIGRAVDRDPVVAALVSKAAATKDAIVTLASADFGADAYTLTRTLLENVIVVSWLLAEDRDLAKLRIDTYILHHEAFKVRFDEVMQLGPTRDSNRSPWASARSRELSSEVFEDKWIHWAWMKAAPKGKHKGKPPSKTQVKLREMAHEVGLGNLYDRDYFLMCSFVHSAPASVIPGPSSDARDVGTLAVDPTWFTGTASRDFGDLATSLSNVLMVHLLSVVNRWYGLALELPLRDARAMILATLTEAQMEGVKEVEKRLAQTPSHGPSAR